MRYPPRLLFKLVFNVSSEPEEAEVFVEYVSPVQVGPCLFAEALAYSSVQQHSQASLALAAQQDVEQLGLYELSESFCSHSSAYRPAPAYAPETTS
jgi:hypothetical protein